MQVQRVGGGELCGVDLSGHRPYAYKRDGIPSVSAVAGLLDGGKSSSFGWVAATIGARWAVHSDALTDFSTANCDHEAKQYCERCAFLRSRFDAEWAAKADLGTHVHHMALSWAQGEAFVDDAVSAPYVDALEKFYADHEPWSGELPCERTVEGNQADHEYRGQFDAIGTFMWEGQRRRGLIDFKTSAHVYFLEDTAQLAAYRFADSLTSRPGRTARSPTASRFRSSSPQSCGSAPTASTASSRCTPTPKPSPSSSSCASCGPGRRRS